MILSNRVPGWLDQEDQQYLRAHYVQLAPLILVPGHEVESGQGSFELLVGGQYELEKGGVGDCLVDGIIRQDGWVSSLDPGEHTLLASNAACTVRRYYPPEAKTLVANSSWLPYFTPPSLSIPSPVVHQR